MSDAFVSRLLLGGQLETHEVKYLLDVGCGPRVDYVRNTLQKVQRCSADMAVRFIRSISLLECKAILKAIGGLRECETERCLGFGYVAEDVHEDELERQHFAAQVNFQVFKRLVPVGHGIPPDLHGLTAEDWYVAYQVADRSRCPAEGDGPFHSKS